MGDSSCSFEFNPCGPGPLAHLFVHSATCILAGFGRCYAFMFVYETRKQVLQVGSVWPTGIKLLIIFLRPANTTVFKLECWPTTSKSLLWWSSWAQLYNAPDLGIRPPLLTIIYKLDRCRTFSTVVMSTFCPSWFRCQHCFDLLLSRGSSFSFVLLSFAWLVYFGICNTKDFLTTWDIFSWLSAFVS